jgi:hypothetical protein
MKEMMPPILFSIAFVFALETNTSARKKRGVKAKGRVDRAGE